MPHILIIDSDTPEKNAQNHAQGDPSTGEGYALALRACRDDLELTIVAPYSGTDVPAPDAFDGVVFTGSGVDWNTQDARAEPLAQVMRVAFAKGVPTLGSCNGMQLAASVLGGRSEVSPKGREDGIARDIKLTVAGRNHPMLVGRTDGYAAPCIHRDEVTELPAGAVLLAGNAHSAVQAFAYEQGGIRFWGVQYHPEYPADFIGRMVGRTKGFPAEQAQDLRCADTDNDAAARLGIRAGELAADTRLTELRNWLASL